MAKSSKMNEVSLLVLRFVLGVIFLYHGYVKLFVPGGFKGTVAFFTAVGIPAPGYAALLSAAVEFAGGAFLVLGAFTMYSSLALLFNMVVAFSYVHASKGFAVSQGGFEYVLLIAASLFMILLNGAGKYALGKKFKSRHLH